MGFWMIGGFGFGWDSSEIHNPVGDRPVAILDPHPLSTRLPSLPLPCGDRHPRIIKGQDLLAIPPFQRLPPRPPLPHAPTAPPPPPSSPEPPPPAAHSTPP